MRFKRILTFILAVLVVLNVSTFVSLTKADAAFSKATANKIAEEGKLENLKAKAYAALYFDSGEVVFESATSHDRFSVGNLIKLMTLYLTFEAVSEGKTGLKSGVKVSKAAQNISVGRERVFLDSGKGEVITVEEAVIGMIVGSANDCAYALAEHISGTTEEAFVEMMNEKAAELGLSDTVFKDSTGILIKEDGQYTSARDLCVLSYRLVKDFPDILKYSKITSGMFVHNSTGQPDTQMQNSNALVFSEMMDGADGLLVGYSKADLYAQAASALVGNERVIAVVIGEETPELRAGELKFLLNLTARSFETKELDKEGTYVRMINIKDGTALKVKTCTGGDFTYIADLTQKHTIERKIVLDGKVEAPVSKGDVVGKVVYQKIVELENGEKEIEEIGSVDLLIDEDVDRAGWFTRLIRRILSFFGLMDY